MHAKRANQTNIFVPAALAITMTDK